MKRSIKRQNGQRLTSRLQISHTGFFLFLRRGLTISIEILQENDGVRTHQLFGAITQPLPLTQRKEKKERETHSVSHEGHFHCKLICTGAATQSIGLTKTGRSHLMCTKQNTNSLAFSTKVPARHRKKEPLWQQSTYRQ